MHQKELPRPFGVGFTCILVILVAVWSVARGMIELNEVYYTEAGPWVCLQIFLGPAIAVPAALFMLRGKDWARWVFWFAYGPVAIWLLTLEASPTHWLRLIVFILGAVLLLMPSARSFFAGENYRRRVATGRRASRTLVRVPKSAAGSASGKFRY